MDVSRAAEALAARLPEPLLPLAELAYNYWWSWQPAGEAVFRDVDPHRWGLTRSNPVRFLQEVSPRILERAAADEDLVARIAAFHDRMRADLDRPASGPIGSPEQPIAFACTEFAVHGSLPLYAGGLGVLAGDYLKEASDQALPVVGIGLFYRQGYLRQRLDPSGWQHEFWTFNDPERMPMALVHGPDGLPLTIRLRIRSREIAADIWRVNVGRVPLYLLDTQHPDNSTVDAWITSRLYVDDRRFRLAQYALLGVGGMRALWALGYEPSLVHLNEGHASLALLEEARREVAAGRSFDEALGAVRSRTVFTTHTPIAAGNESYPPEDVIEVLGTDFAAELGVDPNRMLGLGRSRPEDASEPFGLTPVGIRTSRFANGVSRRHGAVARGMWAHLYPGRATEDVPIAHVTNGVHLPTWIGDRMRALLERHLGPRWLELGPEEVRKGIDDIPDAELWTVRSEQREALVSWARGHAVSDRLSRGETVEYAEAASRAFHPDVLTVGFARRAASYKRIHLLTHDAVRAAGLLGGPRPIQVLLAGKPHPADDEAKRVIQHIFELKAFPQVAERVAYLEDYDLAMAAHLVSGCDLWVNMPRPPLEASGTSGMKAALNGSVNLSVLDGWWEEAFDGTNGWGISSDPTLDAPTQDAQDATAMYDLLEGEVLPRFYDRGPDGVPHAWMPYVKASVATALTGFTATRMVSDYVRAAYAD